jgi:hypothetical protein
MNAIAPAQVAFMKQVGMPLATEATITYTEILPLRRLGYFTLADFVPRVVAYEVATLVEMHPSAKGVRMVLTLTRCTMTFGRNARSWVGRASCASLRR